MQQDGAWSERTARDAAEEVVQLAYLRRHLPRNHAQGAASPALARASVAGPSPTRADRDKRQSRAECAYWRRAVTLVTVVSFCMQSVAVPPSAQQLHLLQRQVFPLSCLTSSPATPARLADAQSSRHV